ncbi:RNA polymerase sigma factor [Chryseolinea lacunae]|uniref:Sigma-70 family RNA polymerase sigma factor n=1 Tax=Chryseolinea lacunae TaxID=2801331 RepID=A0ABS1KYP2_9BACT|nr:sigma-70 family RNA polymerase sigma factor [Chryseolinea lacunae]MBL0744570.1 sigma-70 family RNA polymerase sigma factor [Chryseolinea lacunae]
MANVELIPHLFRTEYRKIVSVLCKRFGFDQMETAEDIASDTFLTATQTWGLEGTPPNPTAWLYAVAKNKAKNHLQRHELFESKISPQLKATPTVHEPDLDLSPQNINDSQLQMMFALCHPVIPAEAQVGLALRILCGFGIEEIADAFLTQKETINKRLLRAKEKLRDEKIDIVMPDPAQIDVRLDPVLTTLYLVFNEGYYSVSSNNTLRKDLCLEAMRLCTMLVENKATNKPRVNALLALMCFHASRFDARLNTRGELVLYDAQDTNLWNTDLISKGGYFLHCAATGTTLSKYHLEAGIAYWNTQHQDTREKWESMLQLYNQLLQIEYTPIAALNRTYALWKANGKAQAIREAEKLKLTSNHFYYALLGDLYTNIDNGKAKQHFEEALMLARTETDKQALRKKLDLLS